MSHNSIMRSAKVGVARQIEKKDKLNSGRKSSTSSKGTLRSFRSNEGDKETTYTRKELKEYRQLFNMFDTDGSGAIGNEELKQAMLSIGMHANESEIDNVIREVDADGNGEIDFDEFCACMQRSQSIVKTTNEELIRECFEVFDRDGNGIITENEFKYVAKEFGDFSDDLAEKVFRELDVTANGHLSADQFANIVEDYLLSEPLTRTEDLQVQRIQERQARTLAPPILSARKPVESRENNISRHNSQLNMTTVTEANISRHNSQQNIITVTEANV